ncbi:WD repeat-containing protein 90-like isoform X3 [Actinia tenebrosa]|uniref:WD repeat-containing protein 90-like isoform X1 n=1 Tax=Actinia tenebrosa TaxID=6105 RepID=A0A6P8IRM2_ACTTE|nr:WD repeat-containing protein 90-like isoform X1 [Actinia tenebrosa]XP_031569796.1 WD repeat-containing protein 90-like isoform X2 [Actinia tenebrosa]XP_031569804.1 WD repeat-containing protein 90-like isoform X3 [Actinia tenebrosa]
MHEPDVPSDVFHSKREDEPDHFTAVCYADDNIMYTGTNEGVLLAWDTQQNKCFIHWKADSAEIDVLVCGQDRLITGGYSGSLKLWSVAGIPNIKKQGENYRMNSDSLVMEDEMTVDGAVVSACFDDILQTGIVGTTVGTLWYINWSERTSIRLVSGHTQQVMSVVFSATDDKYFATCGSDGVLHLWTTDNLEHLQFQVLGQSCNCIAFCPVPQITATTSIINQGQTVATVHPQSTPDKRDLINQTHCVAGYSDGTVRMFDLGRVEMIMKMQPHAASVDHIAFSPDGRVILSGASDGIIAISNPSTGLTVRLLNDHKGAPITDLHSTLRDQQYSFSGPMLWMAASKDSRVSIWSAKWSQDFCELVDWLSFPTPSIAPDGKALRRGDPAQYDRLPPSLIRFSPSDPDIVIFTGYAMQRAVQFYSLSQRKVVRTAALTQWATSMDISPKGNLIALGTQERLVQLMDYDEGRFQDFIGHCDSVSRVCFSPSGKLLYTASNMAVLAWNVLV